MGARVLFKLSIFKYTWKMSECTCTPTDPKYWFTHYGAVEPGSAMEPNPDCLEHFGHVTPEAAEEIAKVESQWVANSADTCGFEL